MAVDSRIALGVQAPDVMSAISGGLKTGEQLRTSGVREQLMQQQAQANQMSMEQSKQNQALQGMMNYGRVIDGLASIPDLRQRAKVLAQQSPMLEEAGIPVSQLASMDLSDAGLSQLQATIRPFLAKQQAQTPAAVQEFEYFQRVISDPNTSDEQKKAAKIALKLEGGAKTFTPKTVDIGGSKYLQVGAEFFNPQTMEPVATDNRGLPVGTDENAQPQNAQPIEMPKVLTPDMQRDMKAKDAAALAGAKTSATIEAQQGSAEAQKEQQKKAEQAQKTVAVLDNILASDRLDNITGITGIIPFSTGKTDDLLGQVQQLKSLMTADNLGLMTGVLSESDIKIIEGLSNDIRMITDDQGNVTGISGSYQGTVEKLKQMKREMVRGINASGRYLEGQVITNPDTGERRVYRNGKWVK